MVIKPFKRKAPNYFSGFTKLKAATLDSQFNEIATYINKEIVPTLNTLTSAKIPGSINPADANKFLQNVGDYTTRWAAIDNDSFFDNSLSLKKFVKINAGSILATDSSEVFQAISASESDQCLISRVGNSPVWRKLTSDNIQDRGITGDSIADGTITNVNLPAYLIENLIADNSITGDKFQNNAITNAKIANNTLTATKLHPDLAASFASGVWTNIIPDNYLTIVNQMMKPGTSYTQSWETIIRLFNDETKPIIKRSDSTFYNVLGKPTINTVFSASKFKSDPANRWGFSAAHVFGRVTASSKLKDGSIEAARVILGYKPSSSSRPNDFRAYLRRPAKQMVANGAVQMRHLTSFLRNKLESA